MLGFAECREAPPLRVMRKSISPEALSDLIGAIYDCIFAPERWEGVMEAIRAEFGFVTAALGVTPLLSGSPAVHASAIYASAGMDADALMQAMQLGPSLIELWGGLERIQTFPLDEPIICSQVTDPATWPDNAYYRTVGAPRDIFDGVGMYVARDAALVGHLGFGVHRALGAIDEGDVADLRLIAPHIRRAVTISGLFDLKTVHAAAFAATIDVLSVGVVLVDETGGIVHANAAATALLAQDGPIRAQRGRLGLAQPAAQAAIETAIRQAAQDEMKLGQRGIAVPARRENGDPLVIHVLPLKRSPLRDGLAQKVTAALFIAPAVTPSRLPIDALALAYDLTPAEARVFELVCEGRTQAEIGPLLGIAASTAKTHLLHIFEKTGCHRQLDLVKLAATLALPV